MTETLYLRLSDTGVASWGAFDAAGRLVGALGRGSLESARQQLANRRCAVLVNGIDVLSTKVELPAASQARLRQIVPFSLEESFADDLERLVFAIGTRLTSGATQVAAIGRERLEACLTQLRAAGIVPTSVCSEADGVPDIPATLALVIEGGRVSGRRPGQPPFVFDGLTIKQMLAFVRNDAAESDELRYVRVFTDEAGRTRYRDELATLGAEFAGAEVKVLGDGAFAHLAATLAQRAGTNLLQGAYAPKSNWLALAKPWRFAASLAVAAVLLALVVRGAEFVQLRRLDAELGDTLAASCQRLVGEAGVAGCQREVRQRLGATTSGAGESFLSTLAAVAAARDDTIRLDNLSYRNGTMNLQLIAPSVPALDQFARAVGDTQRFAVEIEAANPTDAGAEGRIRIAGAGP